MSSVQSRLSRSHSHLFLRVLNCLNILKEVGILCQGHCLPQRVLVICLHTTLLLLTQILHCSHYCCEPMSAWRNQNKLHVNPTNRYLHRSMQKRKQHPQSNITWKLLFLTPIPFTKKFISVHISIWCALFDWNLERTFGLFLPKSDCISWLHLHWPTTSRLAWRRHCCCSSRRH